MQRIWLLSDLHQEFRRDPDYGSHPLTAFDPTQHAPASFDVVILAGDIDVPLTRSLQWVADRFSGVPVVYVPGNHDFYVGPGDPSRTMEELQAEGRDRALQLGVHLLMDNDVTVAGVRYLGGTLWTDFNLGPGTYRERVGTARGRMGMNDYRVIKRWSSKHPGKRKQLRPEDTIAAHIESRRFLNAALEEANELPTVVVTHHAPLADSVDITKRLVWCYANRMEYLFDHGNGPDLWVHGHIHRPVDYMRGRTRVVSNPRGYAFLKEDRADTFRPNLVLEVPSQVTVAASGPEAS
jgi:predicted phosphodiesterase